MSISTPTPRSDSRPPSSALAIGLYSLLWLCVLVPVAVAESAVAAKILGPSLTSAALAADEEAGDDDAYRDARELLEKGRYGKAAAAFEKVAESGGKNGAAAAYWQAYALHKDGHSGDALRALKILLSQSSARAWHDDAQALVMEIQAETGRPVRPRESDADEIKMLAIQSLMHDEPSEALPILERYLDESQPAEYRKMALFVLGQSDSKEAGDLLIRLAKGERGRELQMGGLHFLAATGRADAEKVLLETYQSAEDTEIRAAALQGLMHSGDTARLVELVRSETDPQMRAMIYRHIGHMGGIDDLVGQYRQEKNPAVAAAIIEALAISGQEDPLIELARNEKEPSLKAAALRGLGLIGSPKALAAARNFYTQETEPKIRAAALHALFLSGEAAQLVEIARQETDPQMKRMVVEQLANMSEPEARAYMRELLRE